MTEASQWRTAAGEATEGVTEGRLLVNADGVIVEADGAAGQLFSRGAGELVGATFGCPPPSGVQEVELLQSGGGVRTVEMRTTETTWDGETVVMVALRDTRESASEVEVLRQVIARKDSVVANITHELKNPITVITGFADTLRRHWDSIDEQDRFELIGRIHAMGERMGHTVENLLKLSRMESGESTVHPTEVHLSRLIFTRLFELGDRAKVIHVSCPPNAAVHADESHVWEIIFNFIENAFKYGAPPVEIRATVLDQTVEIRVQDHGSGVPADFVPHLFERFTRSTSTAESTEGSGLGLSITQALAQANGGDVAYEPNDVGACFVIRLPVLEPGAEPASAG